MDIFENLENLNVSEECFNDILNIVEEIINEISDDKAQQPWRRKEEIAKKKREKAIGGTEKERDEYEDALNDEIKHRAKYDSWFKGKGKRIEKYKEQKAKEEKQDDK